jgi:hypothetical protein
LDKKLLENTELSLLLELAGMVNAWFQHAQKIQVSTSLDFGAPKQLDAVISTLAQKTNLEIGIFDPKIFQSG